MSTDTGEPEAWIPSTDDFGSRLALVRWRMGWNIKEAARECGLPAASWRLWEVDGAQPRNIVTIAMTIANKTGADFLWLCHGPTRGAVHRSAYGRGPRVLARVGGGRNTEPTRPISPVPTTRAVRQTRPIIGGAVRPVPAAIL